MFRTGEPAGACPNVGRITAPDSGLESTRSPIKALARQRVASASVPAERSGLDGESLSFADATFDSALSTWTFVEPAQRRMRTSAGRSDASSRSTHGSSTGATYPALRRRLA